MSDEIARNGYTRIGKDDIYTKTICPIRQVDDTFHFR